MGVRPSQERRWGKIMKKEEEPQDVFLHVDMVGAQFPHLVPPLWVPATKEIKHKEQQHI